MLKAESLQRTGSFKLRGAVHKLAHLGPAPGSSPAAPATTASRSPTRPARRGLLARCSCRPRRRSPRSPRSQAFGGTVKLGGDSVDECVARALERADETGAVFVHPFDDPDVILGQATLGLELLEDVPELETVVVPIGGGGLISGIAGVVKQARPRTRVIGVQVEACAPFPESIASSVPVTFKSRATIADGIAIKRPGELTLPLVQRWVDELVVVSEDDVAEAMVWLLERSKLVVEGGGAVGVAALMAGQIKPAPQRPDRDCPVRRQRRRRPAGGDRPAPRDDRRAAPAPVHDDL